MSDMYPVDKAIAAARESIDKYWRARADNPVIESSHKVNLGAVAASYHVDINVTDLDAAIQMANTAHGIEPPIRRLGSISLADGSQETHFTTAKGAGKFFIGYELRKIAHQKIFPTQS